MSSPNYWKRWYYRLLLSLYPPFLFTGIRCVYVAPDFRHARCRLSLSWLNRNLHGSLFGGSLYAMADPVHAVMLAQLLSGESDKHVVWAKAARIEFLRPGRGTVSADYRIDADDLAAIAQDLAASGRAERVFEVEITGANGEIVAKAEITVYVRRQS